MGTLTIPASDVARRFQVALIKPSHYDDDGYVIQWFRSFIPSNSLAAVHGLVEDARLRSVLGDYVAIDIDAEDETNTRIRPARIIERFRRHGNFGVVFLIGVQNLSGASIDAKFPPRCASTSNISSCG